MILLLFFYFIINIYSLLNVEIWVDESITYNIVNELTLKQIIRGVDVHYGYYLLMKILPHNNIYLLRFYSLIIMTISLFLLYKITKKLFDNKTSFIILTMSVLSVTISYYGTQARMYSLLFLMSVLIMYYFFTERYNTVISLLCITLFIHYYAIFLFIPFIITLYLTENKYKFWNYLTKTTVCVLISLLILSPVLYNQFFSNNNPYRLKPPSDKPTLISLPSMLIFPIVIPSKILNTMMFVFSFVVIFIIIYLISTVKLDKKIVFLVTSFLTSVLIFFLAVIIKIPYHHRYLLMFSPMFYSLLSKSVQEKPKFIKYFIYSVLIFFLSITLFTYHKYPEQQFIEISKSIRCPKNVLHETPFSYLPMSIYLPDCNHYMTKKSDWTYVNHETLYTTEDRINNYNVNYDIYIHYFEDFKNPDVLNNTNITTLRLIKITD